MNDILDRAIWDLCELFRSSAEMSSDVFTSIATLLVWGRISEDKKIPENSQLIEGRDFHAHFERFCLDHDLTTINVKSIPYGTDDLMLKMSDAGVFNKIELHDIAIRWSLIDRKWAYSVPSELADLAVSLLETDSESKVYCPWDNSGQFAARLTAKKVSKVYMEVSHIDTLANLIRLTLEPKPDLKVTDPIINPSAIKDGELIQFDCSVAMPSFKTKYQTKDIKSDYFNRFKGVSKTGDIVVIQHLLAQTKGTIVVILPLKTLFSSGAEAELRKELLSFEQVKSVIALPERLLDNTSTPVCLLILDKKGGHETVRFIDATSDRFFEQTDRNKNKLINIEALYEYVQGHRDDSYVASINVEDILNNGADLQVSRYVLSEMQLKVNEKLAAEQTTLLGDVCELILGAHVTVAKTKSTDDVTVPGMSDFNPKGYLSSPTKIITVDTESSGRIRERQYLQPNDIVVVTRGARIRVGIVPPNAPTAIGERWVAPSFVVVLRCDDKVVDPRALFMQLRSPLGQHQLAQLSVGATIPVIRITDLRNMKILLMNSTENEEAISAFKEEVRIEAEIQELRMQQARYSEQLTKFDIE